MRFSIILILLCSGTLFCLADSNNLMKGKNASATPANNDYKIKIEQYSSSESTYKFSDPKKVGNKKIYKQKNNHFLKKKEKPNLAGGINYKYLDSKMIGGKEVYIPRNRGDLEKEETNSFMKKMPSSDFNFSY